MISLLLLSLIVLASGQNDVAVDWNYDNFSMFGPNFWHLYFKNCGGRMQSPISIDCDKVEVRNLECFNFKGYSQNLGLAKLINKDGKTIEVIPNEGIEISGGGLLNKYKLEQFHFHWGRNNNEGSEHTFGNIKFPLEAHLVHMNEKYATTGEAVQNPDGLVVLAVFFKLCNKSSSVFETIAANLDKVLYANQSVDANFISPLADLLPKQLCSYIRYSGSLTTPKCNEVVTWIIFWDPVCVNPSDLAKLREVRKSAPGAREQFLRHNFRPVQPLNGRKILSNKECNV